MNDFNNLDALHASGVEESPPTPFIDVQASNPNPDDQNSKEQASFISYIQKDRDASFAVISQTNNSLIQNSQYLNASFLMGGLNTSQIRTSQPMGLPLQPGQSFFADLKPKHTGESKMTEAEVQAHQIDVA